MRSRGLIVVEHRGAGNVAVLSTPGMLRREMRFAAACKGGERRTRLRREPESIAYVSILEQVPASRSARNRWNQQDPIAFLERAGFAAEEADVFLVEVDVEELADLALIVADVATEIGEAGSKLVEGIGDGGRATVHFRRAVGEAAEGRWDFDGYGHLCFSFFGLNLCLCTCRCGVELRVQIR